MVSLVDFQGDFNKAGSNSISVSAELCHYALLTAVAAALDDLL